MRRQKRRGLWVTVRKNSVLVVYAIKILYSVTWRAISSIGSATQHKSSVRELDFFSIFFKFTLAWKQKKNNLHNGGEPTNCTNVPHLEFSLCSLSYLGSISWRNKACTFTSPAQLQLADTTTSMILNIGAMALGCLDILSRVSQGATEC